MSKIIGIDLGTTNSCVSIIEGKDPIVIVNEEGSRTTPSVVAFTKDSVLVGQIAKRQAIANPENTVYSAKRFIGTKYNEIEKEAKKVSFEISKGKGGHTKIKIKNKSYTPPEISAKVLQKLKKAAENYTGQEVSKAVITVPAYFNDSQRQATKDAGKIAGLHVERIINEPTAAALAYGLDKNKDEIIAVYDFGGGTFDVSILEVSENIVEVISTAGDTRLGGDNIDEKLVQYLIDEFKKDSGIDISNDITVLQRLREAAEKAKVELSSTFETQINLPFLTADTSGPKHFNITVSRSKFEQLIEDIISKTFVSCRQALKDAKKKSQNVDQVILVGGSTRIPKVVSAVTKFFKKEPNFSVNPDEVVALGAAVQGGILSGDVQDILLLDVIPLSLGIETLGGICTKLIDRNTTIPVSKSEVFSTASDNQSSVTVHVLQGEREMVSDNRTLGQFNLNGIPPSPRGVPQIEVSFDIDANGILKVFAKDKATGKDQSVTITNASGIKEDEIDQMIKDARIHEEEDNSRKALAESKNNLDSLIGNIEATLRTSEEQLGESELTNIKEKIDEAKQSLEVDNKNEIDSAYESLSTEMHKLAEALYSKAATEEDNIVDADEVVAEAVGS